MHLRPLLCLATATMLAAADPAAAGAGSFWHDHAGVILLGIAVVAAQTATIGWLLVVQARRRRAETARREAEARLREGSRMDAVGQLAAGVAHDFNNVLTAILGHADLMAMRLEPGSPLRQHVDTISGAAQRAAGTVRNLLVFARGTNDPSRSCEVERLVQDVVTLLQHAIDRRIAISCHLDPGTGAVRMGADQLQQVLVNLALNARDAMPEGGRLEITSERRVLGRDGAGLGLAAGPYALITVSDTGHGIAPEHLTRIFEPFFTTKPVGKGTGLGLAVVHGAVHGAGGTIRVESRPGHGAVFQVWLPSANRIVSGKHATVPSIAGQTVMLVDDEPVVLAVVGSLLRSCGADVREFSVPAEASAWYAANADAVSLAVLDGNMPGMTGWQLAAGLLEARPELCVVALTGALTAEAQAAWEAAGVTRVLQKPVTREQLQTMLAEAKDIAAGITPPV